MNMDDVKLTAHFMLSEFTRAHDFPKETEKNEVRARTVPGVLGNLACVAAFLERIRTRFGAIFVTSGIRTPEYNSRIGGSKNSQHVDGEAADFTFARPIDWTVFAEFVAFLKEADVHFHQVIFYPGHSFIHFALSTGANDGQILVARDVKKIFGGWKRVYEPYREGEAA